MKSDRRQFIWFIVVLVLLFIYGQMNGSSDKYITMTPDEDGIVFSCGERFETQILYEDIASMELVDELDLGESVESTKKGKLVAGTYENDAYGTYELAVYTNVNRFVVITLSDGIFVVNYTTETETAQLYEALLEQAGAV